VGYHSQNETRKYRKVREKRPGNSVRAQFVAVRSRDVVGSCLSLITDVMLTTVQRSTVYSVPGDGDESGDKLRRQRKHWGNNCQRPTTNNDILRQTVFHQVEWQTRCLYNHNILYSIWLSDIKLIFVYCQCSGSRAYLRLQSGFHLKNSNHWIQTSITWSTVEFEVDRL